MNKIRKREYFREYRRRNRAKLRKYNREYNKKWRKENGYHNEYKWIENNLDKVKIQRHSYRLFRQGVLKRKPCPCGSRESVMRHNDYTDPMNVEWLCKPCIAQN